MNHLAHLALADTAARSIGRIDSSAELQAGGILGDFIKGRLDRPRPELGLSPLVVLGIRLHRHIDMRTAREAAVTESALRFGPALRRYAPIMLDIVGDHFLARQFEHFHGQSLPAFTAATYAHLTQHAPTMPPIAAGLCERLVEHDVLSAYTGLDVVHRGFARIATRLKAAPLVPEMADALAANYEALAEDFNGYYPLLQAQASQWLDSELTA